MGDGMAMGGASPGGPFSSMVGEKHSAYKKALKTFKKNSLIKMYFKAKDSKGKNELVKKVNESLPNFENSLDILNWGNEHGYSKILFQKFVNLLIKLEYSKYENAFFIAYQNFGEALNTWSKINYIEAEEIINKSKLAKKIKEYIIKRLGMGIKETQKNIDKMKNLSQKFPFKPYKLKENIQNYFSMAAYEIYIAGIDWKQFNYEKGLDALIQKDETDYYIYHAGVDWPQFNYEKGLNALIQKYKNEVLIYLAGRDWPQFNYEKGLDALKKISKHYYENALEYWPKDIKQTQQIIDKLKKRSKKFPNKPYKINEALALVKFRYSNYKKDPIPQVKVLDTDYPGKVGQKTYNKRRDVLGWNTNYFSNKQEAEQTIDDIDSFARLLEADNKEKYRRIKKLFPEQTKYLRRYIKEKCKFVKVKREGIWQNTDWNKVRELNQENF